MKKGEKQAEDLAAETPGKVRIAITQTARNSAITENIGDYDLERIAREIEARITRLILRGERVDRGYKLRHVITTGDERYADVVMNSPMAGVIRHFSHLGARSNSLSTDSNQMWRRKS